MITVLMMADGRKEYLAQALATAGQLAGPINRRIIHDDSADPAFHRWVRESYPGWHLVTTSQRLGFAGAMAHARGWVTMHDSSDYVFWWEQDFKLIRPLHVLDMIHVLERRPNLIQMALRRQPWNELEQAAGGIVEQHPDWYTDRDDTRNHWLEHRVFFTTNPSLIPRWSITEFLWPLGANSEGRFSHAVFRSDSRLRSAFWGARDSGEWCEHIGRRRVGTGY